MAFDISSIIGGSIGDAFQKIVGAFHVDPTVALEKKVELDEIQLKLQGDLQNAIDQEIQGQLAINKQEAASTSTFVAGWRPFVGWVCGSALGFYFIIAPLGTWLTGLAGHLVAFPVLDMKSLLAILGPMLGFGGARTYEKIVGVAGNVH